MKFIDNDTGFTDIALDPVNTSIVYAASYQRRRSGCCFNGGGPGSALWKSTDAGKSWTKLTGNGLPPGTYGRIALDVSRSNPNVVYAQIEAGDVGRPVPTPPVQQTAATEATPAGAAAVTPAPQAGAPSGSPAGRGQAARRPAAARGASGTPQAEAEAVAAADAATSYNWCNNAGPGQGFGRGGGGFGQPEQPQASAHASCARSGERRRAALRGQGKDVDARQQLQLAPDVLQPAPRRSVERQDDLRRGHCRSPSRSTAARRSRRSTMPAATTSRATSISTRSRIDPKNPKHLMEGNDGGLNISWDQGKSWDFVNTMATALAYVVTADMRRPYYVYVGLQDNGSWGGPSAVRGRGGIMNSHWFGIGGGDGFYTAVDPDRLQHRHHRVAGRRDQPLQPRGRRARTEHPPERGRRPRRARSRRWQAAPQAGGRCGRSAAANAEAASGAAAEGQPAPPVQVGGQGGFGGRGGAPNVLNAIPGDNYRFNWNTPVIMSPHNPKIVWLGGNRLFKSYNQGDTWVASEDLTEEGRSQQRADDGRCPATSRSCRRTTASSPTARSSRSRNHR